MQDLGGLVWSCHQSLPPLPWLWHSSAGHHKAPSAPNPRQWRQRQAETYPGMAQTLMTMLLMLQNFKPWDLELGFWKYQKACVFNLQVHTKKGQTHKNPKLTNSVSTHDFYICLGFFRWVSQWYHTPKTPQKKLQHVLHSFFCQSKIHSFLITAVRTSYTSSLSE